MRELHETYESRVSFKALFPGPLENDSTLSEFKKKYKLPFELALDSSEHYRLGATVTPEVAVEFNNKLIYLGRIDNSFEAVGKKRAVADSFELRNCLDKLLNNEPYALQYVSPIGCIIEKNR